MVFNSLQFAGFFALVWALVWALARGEHGASPARLKWRNAVLLIASYVFYGAWDWRFLSLIVFSTVVDYAVGARVHRCDDDRMRKRWLQVSLATNLGLLGVFKYFDFFSRSLFSLLARLGVQADPWLLEVVLPVGISFYTFQTLSYTIDIYRRRLEPTTSLLEFATFVAFFPQLVAGPIERARDLLPQFAQARPITAARVERGLHFIGMGLMKKVVIADNLALVADAVFALDKPTGPQVVVGVVAFAFQIYGDFSGYTDIARGVACCMGFDLSKNFELPYFATTPSEFWRRWHISLSSWLRDYLYISLGGNRGGALLTYRNLMLTMVLGGLWHGAAWTFVAWGVFHGAVLCLYRWLEPRVRPLLPAEGAPAAAVRGLGMVFYFQITCASWLLFRATSMDQVWSMIGAVFNQPFSMGKAADYGPWQSALCVLVPLWLIQLRAYRKQQELPLFDLPPIPRGVVYALMLVAFVWLGSDGASPFIYFQF